MGGAVAVTPQNFFKEFFVNEAFWIAAQTSIVPLAWGEPGTGKTRTVEAFAKANKRRCISVSLSQHEPSDIGGYPRAERDSDGDGYVEFVLPKFLYDCKKPTKRTKEEAELGFPEYPKSVLFLDELTTCSPATQGAALRLMTHATEILGEDTWVISAANPPGCAANGFALEPPMVNRLYHHDWETSVEEWSAAMLAGFPDGNYPILKSGWQSEIPKSRAFIVAFLSRYKSYVQKMPKRTGDQRDSGSQCAWSSYRSWDNASILFAAANSLGYESSKQNMNPICSTLLRGTVGDEACNLFFEWKHSCIFPSWEETKKLVKTNKLTRTEFPHKNQGDKVMAYLASMYHEVHEDLTEENIIIGWNLFELACEYGAKDIAVAMKTPIWEATNKFVKSGKTKKKMLDIIPKKAMQIAMESFGKVFGIDNK